MNADAVFHALGLAAAPTRPDGMALGVLGGRAVSVATSWSAANAELAMRRRTPLLVVANGPDADLGGPGAVDGFGCATRPWPIVAITDSPVLARAADFAVLVGVDGPADHAGLDEQAAAALVARFLDLAFDSPDLAAAAADPVPVPAPAPAANPDADAAGAAGAAARRSLLDVVPFAIDEPYDVRAVLDVLLDGGAWVAFDEGAAPEVLTAVGRIGGRSVAIAASQPGVDQGVLSAAGLAKVERLVRFCGGGGRALVTLVDTNGCHPPGDIDELTALRRTATAVRAAAVLKVAVVLGRAVGLGATVLGAVGARADAVLPWPRARFALSALDGSAQHDAAAAVRRAAREADVRDIIHPDDTRARLIELLEVLRGPREYAS